MNLNRLLRFLINAGFPQNVNGNVKLGKNVKVRNYSTLSGGVAGITVGDNALLAEGVKITTSDGSTGVYYQAPVKIGRNAFIGTNAIILQGVTVGDNAIVGAGSIVLANTVIPANECWAGVPERKISDKRRKTK